MFPALLLHVEHVAEAHAVHTPLGVQFMHCPKLSYCAPEHEQSLTVFALLSHAVQVDWLLQAVQ